MLRRFICFLLFLGMTPSLFGEPRRLGVVDIEADNLSTEEKSQILKSLRSRLSQQRILRVVREEEMEAKLIQKNPQSELVEKLRADHKAKRAEIEKQLDEGRRYYLASEFEKAISILQSAFLSFNSAALSMSPQLVLEVLKYLAACHYFMENTDQAKTYLEAMLDLDPNSLLSAQKFPPDFIALFNTVKSETRFSWTRWNFSNSPMGVKANLLGFPLSFEEGATLHLEVPLEHPLWRNTLVVFEKEGFAPLLAPLNRLPTELHFETLSDKRESTAGLFAPIGSMTAPTGLKKIVDKLNLDIVFLGSVSRDLSGNWLISGHWYELETHRTSPVLKEVDRDYRKAASHLAEALIPYLTLEGSVRSDLEMARDYGFGSEVGATSPIYKKWWFWTTVGVVAAAGLGTGAYFLFREPDRLKFQIQAN